jgi:hypothetical protein
MSNTIVIQSCDNELYLILYQWNASYQIAHIQSGNNNAVAVNITITTGDYATPPTLNGVSEALNETYSVGVPAGDYTLVPACVNWGGPWAYSYTLNGTPFSASEGSGAGEIGPDQTITVGGGAHPKTTIVFSGLVSGGSTAKYTESGYALSGVNIYASDYGLDSPQHAAFPSDTSTVFTLTAESDELFNLLSAELIPLNSQVGAQSVTFTGKLADKSTVTFVAKVTASLEYQPITFPATFQNLQSVNWTPGLTCITGIVVQLAS